MVGEGDHHDTKFGDQYQASTFEAYEEIVNFAAPVNKNQTKLDYCRYRFMVFPTQEMEDEYITTAPIIYAAVTAVIFLFTSLVFILYDLLVRRRQDKVMESAQRTNAIVSSLFPQNVRDRLLQQAKEQGDSKSFRRGPTMKMEMETFLHDGDKSSMFSSEPIADLFPSAVRSVCCSRHHLPKANSHLYVILCVRLSCFWIL